MHFSLITPTPGREREAAHEWARNSYAEHQWLWRFLPAPPGTARSFLFCRHDTEGLPRIYVVSERAPVAPSAFWHVATKPYTPVLSQGDVLAFELRANPVVSKRSAHGKAVRHDVVMQEKTRLLKERGLARWGDWRTPDRPALPNLIQSTSLAWLQARCARLGFELDRDLNDQPSLRVDGYEQHRGKGGELRLSTVDFSGRLRVTDPVALRKALYEGVGHGKAFGCGLLLVRHIG